MAEIIYRRQGTSKVDNNEIIYSRQGTSEVDDDEDLYKEIEEIEVTETKKKLPQCEMCARELPFLESVAFFLCFACEMYVCVKCMPEHEWHDGMKVGRKGGERNIQREKTENGGLKEMHQRIKHKGKELGANTMRMPLEAGNEREGERKASGSGGMEEQSERKITLFLDELMNESMTERTQRFDECHVCIYDQVNVKHELDQEDCLINGSCVLENKSWVVCDCLNSCIKIFQLGSNDLQRYIRFDSGPRDVTEILDNQIVSGSTSEFSVIDRVEKNKQCVIAVTLPMDYRIMFIDLSKRSDLLHRIIDTEESCFSIQFFDNKIYTVGCEGDFDSPFSVYVLSTDGYMLNKFNIGIYGRIPCPHLAVVSGRVYFSDTRNNKIQCRDVDGQFISEIEIEGSGPRGITVDQDNNVYLCAKEHNKVYKLDSDLTRCNSLLDQSAGYLDRPLSLCYYKDKLFISHYLPSSLCNIVTVVGLV